LFFYVYTNFKTLYWMSDDIYILRGQTNRPLQIIYGICLYVVFFVTISRFSISVPYFWVRVRLPVWLCVESLIIMKSLRKENKKWASVIAIVIIVVAGAFSSEDFPFFKLVSKQHYVCVRRVCRPRHNGRKRGRKKKKKWKRGKTRKRLQLREKRSNGRRRRRRARKFAETTAPRKTYSRLNEIVQ